MESYLQCGLPEPEQVARTETRPPYWGRGSSVRTEGEVLVCRCFRDDLVVLQRACRPAGARVRVVRTPVEMAQRAVAHRPVAVVLGIGKRTLARIEVIPLIRAVWKELPVIVVADQDSLELEKSARQAGIFYYFVHPLDGPEVEAVLSDVLRRSGMRLRPAPFETGPAQTQRKE